MSDDLGAILTSIQNTQQNLLNRIKALEDDIRTTRAKDWGISNADYGLVVPTEPPSTSVILKKGFVWAYGYYNDTLQDFAPITWPRNTVDLADYVTAFDHAYWYRTVLLIYGLRWESFEVIEGTEYENPETASRSFYGGMTGCNWEICAAHGDGLYVPLTMFLIKNNGVTGSAGELEKITLHDRNYSSFLERDMRPWMTLLSTYTC